MELADVTDSKSNASNLTLSSRSLYYQGFTAMQILQIENGPPNGPPFSKLQFYMPVCWNWQTRRTQNPLPAMACGFDPRHRHHKTPEGICLREFLACRLLIIYYNYSYSNELYSENKPVTRISIFLLSSSNVYSPIDLWRIVLE